MPTDELQEPTDERERALVHLKKVRDLQGHMATYLVVNVAVWVIWAVTGAGYPWPAWVTGGWGIALLLNVWEVYGRAPITEADVQREMERLRHQH